MLLPEPDAPMIEITSPCSAESEMPFKTWAEPKLLVMPRASIAIMICRSAASSFRSVLPDRHPARKRLQVLRDCVVAELIADS